MTLQEIKEKFVRNAPNRACLKLFEQNEDIVKLLKFGHNLKDIKYLLVNDLDMVPYPCPFCGKPRHVYAIRFGFQHTCGNKDCVNAARRQIFQEKYGANSPLGNSEVRNKIKQTNLEKYGAECVFASEEIKAKKKETCLRKYGVEYTLQAKEIRNQIEATNLEKYGYKCTFQNKGVQNKFRENYLKNHGVDHPFKDKVVREQIDKTCIEKYGNRCSLQNDEVRDKAHDTMIKKYGNAYPLQNKEIMSKFNNTCKELYGDEILAKGSTVRHKINEKVLDESYECLCGFESIEPLFTREEWKGPGRSKDKIYLWRCKECGHVFHSYVINSTKQPRCLKCWPYNITKGHKTLIEYISTFYKGEIQINDRKVLGNRYELDIYLPDIKLAFEYNGMYFHSVNTDEKNYNAHIRKTELAESKGIHLVHIFEDDWWTKNEIIKNHVKNIINVKTKSYIEDNNYEIKKLTNDEYYEFSNDHSIIEDIIFDISYGVFIDSKLITAICFANNSGEWFINDICSIDLNYFHIEKILNQFELDFNPKTLTYKCDRLFENSINNLFETRLNFKLIEITEPKPFYSNGSIRLNDIDEISKHKNIFKVYDCGKLIFTKKL